MAEGWRKDGGNKVKLSMRMSEEMSEEMSERIIYATKRTLMNHNCDSFLRDGKGVLGKNKER
jgi:hypothetical protein